MSDQQVIKDFLRMFDSKPKPTDTVEQSIRKMERMIKEKENEQRND